MNAMQQLLDFVARLQEKNIFFRLECDRETIMVVIGSASKYYEIEFFEDGHVEMQTWGAPSEVKIVAFEEMSEKVIAEIV